jgi:hypothetical protein
MSEKYQPKNKSMMRYWPFSGVVRNGAVLGNELTVEQFISRKQSQTYTYKPCGIWVCDDYMEGDLPEGIVFQGLVQAPSAKIANDTIQMYVMSLLQLYYETDRDESQRDNFLVIITAQHSICSTSIYKIPDLVQFVSSNIEKAIEHCRSAIVDEFVEAQIRSDGSYACIHLNADVTWYVINLHTWASMPTVKELELQEPLVSDTDNITQICKPFTESTVSRPSTASAYIYFLDSVKNLREYIPLKDFARSHNITLIDEENEDVFTNPSTEDFDRARELDEALILSFIELKTFREPINMKYNSSFVVTVRHVGGDLECHMLRQIDGKLCICSVPFN